MRYVLINGSPEGSLSVTDDLIERFLLSIKGEEYGILHADDEDHSMDGAILNAADAVVLFSAVINGGLPAEMLAYMSHLDGIPTPVHLPMAVYLHTDLYDPQACRSAMEFIENWAVHMKWNMKVGIAVGGDRLLLQARGHDMAETLCAKIDHVISANADVFAKGKQPDVYMKPPLPRFIYGQSAERWVKKYLDENKTDSFQK